MEEADLTKIEKLLDKIERDKKKQQENHNQVEAAKYLDGVNRVIVPIQNFFNLHDLGSRVICTSIRRNIAITRTERAISL